MASWEDIANEIAPVGQESGALATGARRGKDGKRGNLGSAFGVSRYLEPAAVQRTDPADAVWGGREATTTSGNYYYIDRDVTSYDELATTLAARLGKALENPPSRWLDGLRPSDLLFCDIETTGLSAANPLFLIGTMRFLGDEPRLQLYLARDFDEEKAVLEAFSKVVRGKTLVTFNGKSFDWPFIEGRARRHRVSLPEPAGHYDLLFSARRRYRTKLPNCKLQTLEMGVCKRGRKGDIPSSQIPERYHDFVDMHRAGQGAYLLSPVLFHNALDVLTMAELICCMAES
ncbi:hypothetical protein IAD21_04190 [Abditibacteriota bacterium]|nr:hypothetical protein IAD21_04190 [Abditibacteriota bacterium]